MNKEQLSKVLQTTKNYVDSEISKIDSSSNDGGSSVNLLNTTLNDRKSLYNAKPIRPLITFTDDDGKAGVYTKWLPILIEKNIPMSICIITEQVGNTGYLTWNQIKSLQDDYSCEILSHTATHKNIGVHETNDSWIDELRRSKESLINQGLNVRGFAYPNGGYWGTKEG